MHSELKHPRRRFFATTVNGQETLTLFAKKLCLWCLTRLWMHLCTPKLIYNLKIKIKTGTSQSAERRQAPWNLFSAKFNATANDLDQEKTQLRCHEDILYTGNCYKICLKKSIIERVVKSNINFKIKCNIMLKLKKMMKIVSLLGTGEK